MLPDVNKYIKDLKTTVDIVPLDCDNFQIVIRADRKPGNANRGRYNASSSSEVALVMVWQQFDVDSGGGRLWIRGSRVRWIFSE